MQYSEIITIVISLISCLIAFLAYKKASSVKSMEMRIERKGLVDKVKIDLGQLKKLLPDIIRSRKMRASAQGILNSGTMRKWEIQHADIENKYKEINEQFIPYENAIVDNLEKDIIQLNKLDYQISNVLKECNQSLSDDKEASLRLAKTKQDYFNRKMAANA